MSAFLPLLKRIRAALPQEVRGRLPKRVGVFEVSPETSCRLNRRYRKKNKPAQTLSFRYDALYGEILLCPFAMRKEAKSMRHSYKYWKTRMIAHGLLHLAGIHHEHSARDAARGERIEQKILRRIFIHS